LYNLFANIQFNFLSKSDFTYINVLLYVDIQKNYVNLLFETL
jgi:hypothetical protein